MDTKNATAYVLSAYSLSAGFQKEVARETGGDATYISASDLRRMGPRGMFRFLRKMNRKAALFIPLEDPQSESLYPLLLALAALSSVDRIVAIGANCSLRKVRRLEVISAIRRVGMGTIAGMFAAARSLFAAILLLRRPRQQVAPSHYSRRILYLNANYWFGVRVGGSVGHIAGVANAFLDLGYDVDLASAGPQPMVRPAVRQIHIGGLGTQAYPIELNLFRFHWRALRRLRTLPGNGYQFIYQRMSLFNFTGVALSWLWRIPLILEYNGSEVWIARNWGKPLLFSRLGALLEDVCLRHAHRVVVVSQALADEVVERGVDSARVVCYPNCVDPSLFSPDAVSESAAAEVRERYGIPADAVLIAFVGTFGRWHGAPVLAEAIRNLVDRDPAWLEQYKVRFAMIGDGATMPTVRKLIGGPEYARWVVFTGLVPQSETVKYLAASDILMSPHVANADGSRFFGSPTKLFEYMAMGKGIVASDLDQIGEILAEGIRIGSDDPGSRPSAPAVLVRPGNVVDLEQAIRLLVENPALRRAIGAGARAQLLGNYTWRHHVEHILDSMEGHQVPDALPATENSALIA